MRVLSRRGADLTTAFPEVAAPAVAQLPAGTVVDVELLIWAGDRPDFGALQRRVAARRRASAAAAQHPASLLVFDLPATSDEDMLGRPLRERRRPLEELAAGWAPPLQLGPGTDDLQVARSWLEGFGRADVGIEGLMVKGLSSTYQPGSVAGPNTGSATPPRPSSARSSAPRPTPNVSSSAATTLVGCAASLASPPSSRPPSAASSVPTW